MLMTTTVYGLPMPHAEAPGRANPRLPITWRAPNEWHAAGLLSQGGAENPIHQREKSAGQPGGSHSAACYPVHHHTSSSDKRAAVRA